MSGAIKKTTGLTGIAVARHAHRDLNLQYYQILRALRNLPQESAYRQHTEKLINERRSILQETKDLKVIEDKIGAGQMEELMIQAKYELTLARQMEEWKPWENLIEEPPRHQWTWPPHK